MTARPHLTANLGLAPAAGLAILAMFTFQMASALSRPLMAEIGAPAVTFLRMAAASLLLLVWLRPRLAGRSRASIGAALLLGGALAAMSLASFEAIARLPIGMVTTIAVLGPLSLSVIGARANRARALGFAALAGLGVVLILAPLGPDAGTGWVLNPLGLAISLAYAGFWALYILCSRKVGQTFKGSDGLSLSFAVATFFLAPLGMGDLLALPQVPGALTLLGAAALGLLAPCLACGLEMRALRKLDAQTFGILMSLEPVVATFLGFAALQEVPSLLQFGGMIAVSIAAAGAVFLPRA